MKTLTFTEREWRYIAEAVVWAEYVNRDVHWAEGDPRENEDTSLGRRIVREHTQRSNRFWKAVKIIEGKNK